MTAALAGLVLALPATGIRAQDSTPRCAIVRAKLAQAMGTTVDPPGASHELTIPSSGDAPQVTIACPDARYVKISRLEVPLAKRPAYLSLVAKLVDAVAESGPGPASQAVTRCMATVVRIPHPVGKVGRRRAGEIAKIPYFRGRVELGSFELVCHYETRNITSLEFDLYPL